MRFLLSVMEAVRKMLDSGVVTPEEGFRVYVHPDSGFTEEYTEFSLDGARIPVRVVHSTIVEPGRAYVANTDMIDQTLREALKGPFGITLDYDDYRRHPPKDGPISGNL